MATSLVIYKGKLRTDATHIRSNNSIVTDAPVDNNGKGEAFSPTDLLATSLANCMLTVMGILAQQKGINIDNTRAEVTKIMADNPRRVSEIHITVHFPTLNYSDKEKAMLEHTAATCPVAKSLHPDIQQKVEFKWS